MATMTKPVFLAIFCNSKWNGSSPFVYTLQRTLKYAHFGYTKGSDPLPSNPYLVNKIFTNTWENWNYNESHLMNHSEDLQPLKDFPLSHLEKFLQSPQKSKSYTQFYTALYNHVSTKGYKAVADVFSTSSYDKGLYLFFDVKPIILFRDPVRRAISQSIKFNSFNNNPPLTDIHSCFADYISHIKLIHSIFPNPLILTMEELWEDDGTTKQKLSQFLDHPVDSLWPNLYSPDIGHHLTWDLQHDYCPTPCQVIGQSYFEITQEIYNYYRNKYSYIYDNWKKHFGSLPLHWGEPIDYDKNLQVYPHYNLKKPLRDFL